MEQFKSIFIRFIYFANKHCALPWAAQGKADRKEHLWVKLVASIALLLHVVAERYFFRDFFEHPPLNSGTVAFFTLGGIWMLRGFLWIIKIFGFLAFIGSSALRLHDLGWDGRLAAFHAISPLLLFQEGLQLSVLGYIILPLQALLLAYLLLWKGKKELSFSS
jgi:uncharacterized membrane protein YhaH (DUF805 family)